MAKRYCEFKYLPHLHGYWGSHVLIGWTLVVQYDDDFHICKTIPKSVHPFFVRPDIATENYGMLFTLYRFNSRAIYCAITEMIHEHERMIHA